MSTMPAPSSSNRSRSSRRWTTCAWQNGQPKYRRNTTTAGSRRQNADSDASRAAMSSKETSGAGSWTWGVVTGSLRSARPGRAMALGFRDQGRVLGDGLKQPESEPRARAGNALDLQHAPVQLPDLPDQ